MGVEETAGVPHSETKAITISELFHCHQKLASIQEKLTAPAPTPILHPLSILPCLSPHLVTSAVSYWAGEQQLCVPLTIKWWSAEILHVLALVDTGNEVTVLKSNINSKESTSPWSGGNLTPALRAKVP